MITSSGEAEFTAKEERGTSDFNISKATSSSTTWSRLKDPRIVRASRAFGGKDRHSKVCTVKGLRDRRVRLSVPTAIELYNLQDRLGLNQPSKVVDWLLNAAKHEIDKLPPLQMPLVNFTIPQLDKQGININKSSGFGDPFDLFKRTEEGKQSGLQGPSSDISSNILCARSNHTSLTGLINNAATHNSFLRWDPSNLSLSNFGSNETELHSFNVLPLPSTTQSYFPAYVGGAGEFDPKQVHFQMSSSTSSENPPPSSNSPITPPYFISQPIRPFHLSMTPNLFPPK